MEPVPRNNDMFVGDDDHRTAFENLAREFTEERLR
jgi:hypothetical protein